MAESAHQLGKIGHLLAVFALTAFVALNLLVGNQYLYQLARNGSPGSWSDAIYPLAKSLREAHASRIGVLDWGMVLSLDVLDRGRLPLVWSYDVPARGDTSMLQDGQLLWLSHTDGNEQFAGTNARFATFVEKNGFRKTSATLYYDRNGRPIFQTFRVVPSFRTQ